MSQTNQMNNPDQNSSAEMDRISHASETFLHKYRWWIVLVLAVLLALYLYSKRTELGIDMYPTKQPVLDGTVLNIGTPAQINIGTETRTLFRL